MNTALLALAAAALLVCARSDTTLYIVGQENPNNGQDSTNNDSGERNQDLNPSDHLAQYSENDSDEMVPVVLEDVEAKNHDTGNDTEFIELHRVTRNTRRGRTFFYEKQKDNGPYVANDRHAKSFTSGKKTELPSACLYDGRWHSDGAVVNTREDCLRCACAGGALSCRRRACAPLPDLLPPRCHVRHRRGSCCPELHCPDGVQVMEHGASARFDSGDLFTDTDVTPATAKNACVEGGSVFAAGSALRSRVACEQCFCLRGARRCVRPTCLPPPPHCAPRPAPGACCPQRYYCDNAHDKPQQHRSKYDCEVDGVVVAEGSPVLSRDNCSACFCLRGAVRCQALGCAPALAGCRPLRARTACCAHQYICDHTDTESESHAASGSSPATRHDERTLHSSKSGKLESTTKKILTSLYTLKHSSFASATKNHLITTTKVKRKTEEPPPSVSVKPEQITNITFNNITTTQKPMSAAKLIAMTESTQSLDSEDSPDKTTEQPEGTVKIMINGTINCTAELSSTSLPLSIVNDTDKQLEVLPRIPIVNVEAQTYSPNDIITDRNMNGGFDDEDSFTINVTSSLVTNTSHSTKRPAVTAPKVPVSVDLAAALNSSKKKKGEYDYDYTEPTLPPSLPNLKIIPFVAADAVVDDEPTKETLAYPILEREDKFPVYYPSATKESKFPIRREDTYQPTQYPVFVLGKGEPSYPPISHEVDVPRDRYPERDDPGVHEYTVSASLGSSDVKTVTQAPPTSTTFAVETPAVNLFSPPVETEGGFLPKGSGVIDEYFGVYPSTPSGPAVPHLTTSMQLDVVKDISGECSVEGSRVASGQSIVVGCQLCACAWGELSCARRPCAPPPPPCRRAPPSNHSQDVCCGDVDCQPETNTATSETSTSVNTSASANVTVVKENKQNFTKVEILSTTTERSADPPSQDKTETANNITNNTEKVAVNEITTPAQETSESIQVATTAAALYTTSVKPTLATTTTTPAPDSQLDESSLEEEDEDDDGGFSFGSVLKLLLSDSYETTTTPSKKPTTRAPTKPPSTPPYRTPSTTTTSTSRPEEEQSFFKPLPPRQYNIPMIQPNTVNRIDHLVLGEATAIKRPTPRPIANKTRPPMTSRPTPQTYEIPTEQTYERPAQQTHERERPTQQTYERPTPQTHERERPTQQTYERPTPQTHERERPTQQTYERPTPQTHERERPTQQTYERPTPQTHNRPTPQTYERPTHNTYDTTEKRPVMQEESVPFQPIATGGTRPPSLGSGVGSGLLKLAGCNIYGRMYRVGRIITELSTPCSECWCTELGVQCKTLNC